MQLASLCIGLFANLCHPHTSNHNTKIASPISHSTIPHIQVNEKLNTKITNITDRWLGQAYVNNPLGDEIAPDSRPIINLQQFDCQTLVSSTLAQLTTGPAINYKQALIQVRYHDTPPSYQNRNHLVGLQYNRHNRHILHDITELFKDSNGQKIYQVRNTTYNLNSFLELKKEKSHKLSSKTTTNITNQQPISYLGREFVLQGKQLNPRFQQQLQLPAIIEFIRPQDQDLTTQIGTDVAVSHMGIIIEKNNKLKLRHASSKLHKVTEIYLAQYLNQYYTNFPNGGIKILAIYQPHG